jgi:Ribosomal silencing factor during starvation
MRPCGHVEGQAHCDWAVIDIGDIIVHVFRPEVREFYNIEKIWSGEQPSDPLVSASERISHFTAVTAVTGCRPVPPHA